VTNKAPLAAGSGLKPTAPLKPFQVHVADNFHYMDDDEIYIWGSYATYDAALKVCKEIVLKELLSEIKPGRTPKDLYKQYTSFGDDPFIVGPVTGAPRFSARDYARALCNSLAAVANTHQRSD
jgi:hypothetical protein